MENQLSRIWFELTKGLTIIDIQAEFQSILETFLILILAHIILCIYVVK